MDYPYFPGAADRDTSQAAARDIAIKVSCMWLRVLNELQRIPQTTHECANNLGLPVSTVQPRISELARQGKLRDTGLRRVNTVSNKKAIVWEVVGG
jgi:predicted transcriptional regulator